MTDKLRAAAQRALETLEDVFGKNKIDVGAINNLRAALAEPEQKLIRRSDEEINAQFNKNLNEMEKEWREKK